MKKYKIIQNCVEVICVTLIGLGILTSCTVCSVHHGKVPSLEIGD